MAFHIQQAETHQNVYLEECPRIPALVRGTYGAILLLLGIAAPEIAIVGSSAVIDEVS